MSLNKRNRKDNAAAATAAAATAAAALPPTPRTQGTIRQSVPQYTVADEDEEEQRDTPYPTPQDRSNETSGTTSEHERIDDDDPTTPGQPAPVTAKRAGKQPVRYPEIPSYHDDDFMSRFRERPNQTPDIFGSRRAEENGFQMLLLEQMKIMLEQMKTMQNKVNTLEAAQSSPRPMGTTAAADAAATVPEIDYVKAAITDYRKMVKVTLADRKRIRLWPENHAEWAEDIRKEALLIEADDILSEKQAAPPEGLSDVDEALWHARSSALFLRILHSLSHKVNRIIGTIDTKSPTQLWDKLQTEFGMPLAKERALLVKELCELKMGSDISEYILKHKTISRKLRDIGTTFDDIVHDTFLTGLGDYQRGFVKTRLDELYSSGRDAIANLDIPELGDQLLNRAKDLKGKRHDTSPRRRHVKGGADLSRDDGPSQSNPRDSDTSGRGRHKNYKRGNQDSRQSKETPKRDQNTPSANLTAVHDSRQSTSSARRNAAATDKSQPYWSLDTCASFHLTGDRNAFTSFYTEPCPDKIDDTAGVEDASGRIAKVSGWGTILLQAGNGHMKLTHVRYVPSFPSNLISYAHLEDQGFTLGIVPNGFSICTPDEYVFIATKQDNRIYRITSCQSVPDHVARGEDPVPTAYATAAAPNLRAALQDDPSSCQDPLNPSNHEAQTRHQTLTLLQWHERLGHLNARDILRLARQPLSGIKIKGSKTLPFCSTCQKAKQTRKVNHAAAPRATKPMRRLHIDMAGGGTTFGDPTEPTASVWAQANIPDRKGNRYFIIFTDDATRYRWVLFIRNKSEFTRTVKKPVENP
jgi:GAG-pre-integrase domain/gag-polypeptide of LTR copia-type